MSELINTRTLPNLDLSDKLKDIFFYVILVVVVVAVVVVVVVVVIIIIWTKKTWQ